METKESKPKNVDLATEFTDMILDAREKAAQEPKIEQEVTRENLDNEIENMRSLAKSFGIKAQIYLEKKLVGLDVNSDAARYARNAMIDINNDVVGIERDLQSCLEDLDRGTR